MSGRKKSVISKASPHTIKKFELIEEYIKSWAQKLLLTESCNGLIFIDCMCNSGVYTDDAGQLVKGTAVRVSEALREASRTYTEKNIHIYLNDKDKARVDELKKHLPQDERNFKIVTSYSDAHELLRTIGPQLYGTGHLHYFLLYDPYDATIDWEALLPFFQNWGEVMINHMVSDPVRAITSAKKKTTKAKYENTYLEDFEKLVPYGSDKKAYEARVEEIINSLKGARRYYVSAYRADANSMNPLEKNVSSLEDYIKLTKASRYHFCLNTEVYTDFLDVVVNAKLRNAIGHNDVEYDAVSQVITYIPNPKDRTIKKTEYLLEFENEAMHMFQALLGVSEYLYRLRELSLMYDDKIPLMVQERANWPKKIGRNDPCPCGSGKKYKFCHGKN